MKTRVVNKYREGYDIYIGRGSIWGNPYSWKEGTKAWFHVNTREESIDFFAQWMKLPEQRWLRDRLPELVGKRLGCFCRPADGFKGRVMCHGQILAAMAEGGEPKQYD